jgi:hypothetical protein
MNTKDIRTSSDQDPAGSYAAMERAAKAAQELAIVQILDARQPSRIK